MCEGNRTMREVKENMKEMGKCLGEVKKCMKEMGKKPERSETMNERRERTVKEKQYLEKKSCINKSPLYSTAYNYVTPHHTYITRNSN